MVAANRVSGGPWLRVVLKVAVLLAVAIGAQTCFGADLRVHDVAPDLMVLVAVVAGFVGGPDTGAVVGFCSGLASDLFLSSTPFGLSALAYCLAGFIVGWAAAILLRPHWYLAPVVAAAGTVLGVALFVIIGYVVGEVQLIAPGKTWLVQVAAVEACYSAIFGLPVATLMGWALRGPGATAGPAMTTPTAVGRGEMPLRRRASGRDRRRRPTRAKVV